MGIWLKSCPCLENLGTKNPPAWTAHTRMQYLLGGHKLIKFGAYILSAAFLRAPQKTFA